MIRIATILVIRDMLVTTDDITSYDVGRAPGYAPVIDACGQAGGKFKQTPIGGDRSISSSYQLWVFLMTMVTFFTTHSIFTTTSLATMGDLGSKTLPKGPSMATWKTGQNAPVTWGMRYNHGGGYQVGFVLVWVCSKVFRSAVPIMSCI